MEKRSEKGMKSKLNYINEYTNENYKTFGAKIKIEEYYELKDELNKKNITNAEFIRWAYEELKKDTN